MRRRCSAPSPAIATDELGKIRYASTATVSLAYRRDDFPRPPDSFGFVVPAIEKRKIMACTFSSLKYPGRAPEGHILIARLRRRRFAAGTVSTPTTPRWRKMFATNWRACWASPPNRFCRASGAIRTRCRSITSATTPAFERIETALNSFPTLALAGSAYHGVGIADCVRTGEEAAEKVVAALK